MKFSISLQSTERVVFIATNNIFVLGWQGGSSFPLHGGCTSYWIYWRWTKGSSLCLCYTIIECWKHRILAPHFIWPMDDTVTLKGPWEPILAFLSAWRRDSSREMLEHFPVPKKAVRELEKDFLQWCGVTGQGVTALNWRRADLD